MNQTSWQKFVKHCKAGGFFYAVFRGLKYIKWRNQCKKLGVDYRRFSR